MELIDTHTHLYAAQFSEDREAVMQRAMDAGISTFLLPNIDVESIPEMEALVAAYPGQALPMMGLHPCSVNQDFETALGRIEAALKEDSFYAIGEIGIDLYWDKTYLEQQREAFQRQIRWARERDLPIVIHARDSFEEIFEVMDREYAPGLTGVFHCFTGNAEQARHILSYEGFKLGIGGVVTFKNGGLDKVLPEVPMEAIVLETDAPYLAPAPFRGKRNESSYLRYVAEKVADIYGVSVLEIAERTTANAKKLFRLHG